MNVQQARREVIASRFAMARKQAGLSQAQAANQLKLPRPSISEIEAGRRRVSADELVQFAELYQVDVKWLSGEGETDVNLVRDQLFLAARGADKIKPEDLEKVIDLLSSLRPKVQD